MSRYKAAGTTRDRAWKNLHEGELTRRAGEEIQVINNFLKPRDNLWTDSLRLAERVFPGAKP